jgi:hypothetical protein
MRLDTSQGPFTDGMHTPDVLPLCVFRLATAVRAHAGVI